MPKPRLVPSRLQLFFFVLALQVVTVSASAQCGTPSVGNVTVTPVGEGRVTFSWTYAFETTHDYNYMWLNVDDEYLQTFWDGRINATGTVTTNSFYFTCARQPGPRKVEVIAVPCDKNSNGQYWGRGGTTFDNVTKPEVFNLTYTPDNADGGTISADYRFPNTPSPYRRLELWIDGEWRGNMNPYDESGRWLYSLSTACWIGGTHTMKVVAVACDKGSDERYVGSESKPLILESNPFVDISLRKSTDLSKGTYEAVVAYNFGSGPPDRSLTVKLLSWTEASGTQHASVDLRSIGPADPQSGTQVFWFTPPSGARQLRAYAVLKTCRTLTDTASMTCELCDATADPVFLADGNMRLTDTDPLPPVAGHTLTRTYDSDEQTIGSFGRGFTTIFDMRLMRDVVDGREVVSLVTSMNEVVTFEQSGSSYRQIWPTSRQAGILTFDSAAGTYRHRDAGSTEEAIFRASDGKLTTLRDRATGREGRISYTGTAAASLSDSWTGLTWNLTRQNRRVSSIGVSNRPDLTWTYSYDASGNLITVLAPGGATWRTYEYASNRMTASRDALGNLIESHSFDANGYATSSTGPGDEIQQIEYNQVDAGSGLPMTRVTMKTGAIAMYVLRSAGSAYRTAQISGGCAGCGARESAYVYDADGHIVRQQHATGYITATEYTFGRRTAVEEHLRPHGCDPQTDPSRCRLGLGALATTVVVPTAATLRTDYTYGDANWPDKPTAVSVRSVLHGSGVRRHSYVYDPQSGAVLNETVSGWTGSPARLEARTTTTTIHGGTEVAAFDPGGAFQPAWLTLPQPAGTRRSSDGPRSDVSDVASYVHYPVDASVPAALRGRLAAARNALGHTTRFEGYDEFGNVTRSVDANGVVTEATYDGLGRVWTSTIKGVPGCDTTADALCADDLTTARTYSPAAGPLHTERRPGGGVTVYAYDARGRVLTISRGPSTSALMERIEYGYDLGTGKKSLERFLSFESGSWVEKKQESYGYDIDGDLTSVSHADGSSAGYAYDDAGRVAAIRNENHVTANTTYAYDAGGRLSTVGQTLGATVVTTRYAYDLHGNLVAVTDPNGNMTTYQYDDFGQLLSQQSPVTGATTYEYDVAGNMTATRRANGTSTTVVYDALQRTLTSTSSGPPAAQEIVSWSYDAGSYATGRIAAMTDPAGSTAYRYERRGLLREESRTFPTGSGSATATYVTRYGYDRDGNRAVVQYPSGELTVTYAHDHAGRPITASGIITAAEYLPFGPLRRLQFANGTTQTLSYDSRYRIEMNELLLNATSVPMARHSYAYDNVGNVIGVRDLLDPRFDRQYAYDDLSRLITADTGPGLWVKGSYTWDAMGNILTAKLAEVEQGPDDGLARRRDPGTQENRPRGRSSSFAYAGTTPRLAEVTTNDVSRTVGIDAAGNETSHVVTREYSARNFLQSVKDDSEPGAERHQITYAYDGRGLRVTRLEAPAQFESAARRHYVYTPDLQLLAVSRDSSVNWWDGSADPVLGNSIHYEIVWFGTRPVAQVHPSATTPAAPFKRFTFADHLGTPVMQTDAAGTPIWHAEHEPFGNIFTMRSDPTGHDLGRRTDQPLRFPGQEVAGSWEGQEENYNIFRWYRAGWGRMTQPDPLLNLGFARSLQMFLEDAPSVSFDRVDWYGYGAYNPLFFIDPLGLKVKNNTNCRIYVKDATTSQVYPVYPGQEWTGPQDGYADPCKFPNQVFKTVDGVDVTVGSDHQPDTNASGVISGIGQIIKGGWKDKDWQKGLKKDNDKGWDPLFDKSQPGKCLCCATTP